MATVNGSTGNDFIHLMGDGNVPPPGSADNPAATASADVISSGNGGSDTIFAGSGNDVINFRGDLDSTDRINGGDGNDTLVLSDSTTVVFSATSLAGIETILMPDIVVPIGFASFQSLTLNDANVAAGASMTINASGLGPDSFLTLDYSAETNAVQMFSSGGAGNDFITGRVTSGTYYDYIPNDRIDLTTGGNDTVTAFAFVAFGSTFGTGDVIDVMGGRIGLYGDYSAGLVLDAPLIKNLGRISVGWNGGLPQSFDPYTYRFTVADALVDAGETLEIDAHYVPAAGALFVDARAETNGRLVATGSSGNDTIYGSVNSDTVYAHGGIDYIETGDGADTILGDYYSFYTTIDALDTLDGGSGSDTLLLRGDYSAGLVIDGQNIRNIENVVLESVYGDDDFLIILEGAAVPDRDLMTVTAAALQAGATLTVNADAIISGRLRLIGGHGADRLGGGVGDDTMSGGQGNDTYVNLNSFDVITELGGGGTDTVESAGTFTLSGRQQVENLTLTGAANANASGNSYANVLTGNTGNNILNGSTGADTMIGGLGNDTYYVDDAGDVTVELSGQGTDIVSSSVSRTLSANIENLNLSGTAGIQGNGNTSANIINGNTGSNILRGYEGGDTLSGNGGEDTLAGGTSSDRINPGNDAVSDIIRFYAVGDSTGSQRDIVTGLDLNAEDRLDFTVVPTSIGTQVNTGALNLATFNTDLAAAVNANLAVNGAVLFDPNAGGLNVAGHLFLVVDGNGDGVYTANQDYVVELVNRTGQLTLDDFM